MHNQNEPAEKKQTIIEGIISTTQKGLGFIKDPVTADDIRLEQGFLDRALNRDLVKVRMLPGLVRGQRIGEVIEIVKRAKTRFVGTLRHEAGLWYVDPDDKRAYAPFLLEDTNTTLNADDKVFIEMTSWEKGAQFPSATILEIIGPKRSHEVEIRSIVLSKGIDDRFPESVIQEGEERSREAITDEEIARRTDFRNITTFTIDPVDAKDFDDALSVELRPDGSARIGIHIADVSHYVLPGSALDVEALTRAFSVYLVDRTIPMLPEVLSNDICSLNPNVDRLTFSTWVDVSADEVFGTPSFGKSVIHSDRRFTYEEAQEILNAGDGEYIKELQLLARLAKTMREVREQAGAIDFEQHEVRFELADDGVPLSVYRKERLETHKLIEEFMLLANKSVAEYIRDTYGKNKKHAFIYRVHDHPDREKLQDLATFLKALGYDLPLTPQGDVTGKILNTLFKSIEGVPEEGLIKTSALRSMSKAQYTALNIGHFGLALSAYTHFTSPIRRYADLTVHRLLQEALTTGKLPNEDWATYARIGEQISAREIDVIGAERDSIKYKQVEFMSAHIGETFDAVISGVSEFGIFVEERETKAEGLVRLNTLGDDFYTLEAKKYRIVGQRTKKVFALGDTVRIKVLDANVDKKMIDYAIVS